MYVLYYLPLFPFFNKIVAVKTHLIILKYVHGSQTKYPRNGNYTKHGNLSKTMNDDQQHFGGNIFEINWILIPTFIFKKATRKKNRNCPRRKVRFGGVAKQVEFISPKWSRGPAQFEKRMSQVKKDLVPQTCDRVADFYEGKSVFMTGASGYLGVVSILFDT